MRDKNAMPASKLPLCVSTSSRSLHRPVIIIRVSQKLSVLSVLTLVNRLANNVIRRTL